MFDDNVFSGISRDSTMCMVRIFTRRKTGLTLAHINAQSLNNKVDEFRFVFEGSNVDIVCVSETWLSRSTPDNMINLCGYNVFREDRMGTGGGVAIFVRDNIRCKVRLRSSSELSINATEVEFIFVEISSGDKRSLVGCVYRPNRRIPFTNFFSSLELLASTYDNVIIAGDFNSNIISESILISSMSSFGFSPANTLNPTHHTTTCSTLLDIFFVDDDSKILLYDQVSAPCFSRHDLIFLTYDFNPPTTHHNVYYPDFKHLDHNLLYNNFCAINWNQLYYMPSVDEQSLFIERNIKYLFDMSVPMRSKRISASSRPWFNNVIKSLVEVRNLAYARWKRFRTPELKNIFRIARRNVNTSIRSAKTEYYSRRFGSAVDSKQTWNRIREIGISRSRSGNDCQVDADELNRDFTNIQFMPTDDSFYNFPSVRTINDNYNFFQFSCITQTEVVQCFNQVKSNAVGVGNIHPKFMKFCYHLFYHI